MQLTQGWDKHIQANRYLNIGYYVRRCIGMNSSHIVFSPLLLMIYTTLSNLSLALNPSQQLELCPIVWIPALKFWNPKQIRNNNDFEAPKLKYSSSFIKVG